MKITEFPLGEIPFMAIDRLLNYKVPADNGFKISLFDEDYLPSTTWLEELNIKGRSDSEAATAIVYWYPVYIDTLYTRAIAKLEWEVYLQPTEAYWFRMLFKETATRLDKIASGNMRLNHVDEVLIKSGKVKI